MLLIAAGIEGFWSPSRRPGARQVGDRDRRVPVGHPLPGAAAAALGPWQRRRSRRGGAAVNLLAARVVLRQRSLADVLDLAMPFCLTNKRPLGVLSLVMLGRSRRCSRTCASPGTGAGRGLWVLVGCAASLSSRACSPSRWASCCSSAPRRRARARARARGSSAGCRAYAWSRSSCARWCWRRRRADRDAVFLAPPTHVHARGAAAGGRDAGQGAGAQPRAGAQPAVRLPGAVAGDAVPAGVRRDRDGPHRERRVSASCCSWATPPASCSSDGGSGFAVLGALLAVPMAAAMRFLGYIDLRTRKEGWDIQLRFVALAEQAPSAEDRARDATRAALVCWRGSASPAAPPGRPTPAPPRPTRGGLFRGRRRRPPRPRHRAAAAKDVPPLVKQVFEQPFPFCNESATTR